MINNPILTKFRYLCLVEKTSTLYVVHSILTIFIQ